MKFSTGSNNKYVTLAGRDGVITIYSILVLGAVLLAAGKKGRRFALPNSEVLLHQVMGGVEGQAVEIEITARHIVKIKDKINQVLVKHTGQKKDQIERDTDRDFYLTSGEAREYGIIDQIVSGKK